MYCTVSATLLRFALPEAKQVVVRGLRAALVHLTTHHAASQTQLTAPVVGVVSLPERTGRGDCQRVDAEVKIDTEDRLVGLGVPGICRNLCVTVCSPRRGWI
ncbi:MAG: hypothetical protein J07HQW2_00701 [Haloquadratum walsbyi J07HQW2]|uniref:Uncharacterized protein n=1 Tax=Haloquadratum walsbyi J07HQW2 TaxID=1238425 RepID=U1PKQ0_9EURY|nr:MAG: hypothetical protein J07HQW2_00701 [Haloquadratum walsbyi J07HQW2]